MAGQLTPQKARQILHDKEVRGHKLTDAQRRFFGYMSNKADGGDLPILYFKGGSTVYTPLETSPYQLQQSTANQDAMTKVLSEMQGQQGKSGFDWQKNQPGISAGLGLAGMATNLIAKPGSIGGGVAGGALSGASAGAALGPWGMAAGSVIGGITGLLGAKKAQQQEQIMRDEIGRQQYRQGTSNISPQAHIYALGGEKLTEFNTGGSHEENPLGGIPQGINNSNGQPNLVEQGETKFNDYIFSDRLKLNDAKEYRLGGRLSGLTFADASKKLSKMVDERPNDPIAKRGQEMALNRLKMANDDAIEMKNFEDQNTQYKLGGCLKGRNKYNYGGYTFTDF